MNPEQERLKEALRLLKLYKLNLFGCFKLACEEANTIRYHPQIHPLIHSPAIKSRGFRTQAGIAV